MDEPERTRSLARGGIAYLVVFSLVLGGLCWLFFSLGGLFNILAWIVLVVWAVMLWRWAIQFFALFRERW